MNKRNKGDVTKASSLTERKYANGNRLILVLPIFVLIFFFVDISLGSVAIPLDQIIAILLGGEDNREAWQNIVWHFRLPRAITAILVGMGLAVSGLQMQTLFRNPLAGPFVLGISSGASLGVSLLVLTGGLLSGVFYQYSLNNWSVVIAASLGSLLVLAVVVTFSSRVKDSMALLIIGLMFGSATGAIVSVLQFFSEAEQIQAYLIWTFGSLGGLEWNEIIILTIVVIMGLMISAILVKALNTLLLGERYAQSMGLDVKRTRILIILSTSLLAGGVTAFCGPIAFIGLAVPHLTRIFFNTSDHRVLVPTVALTGAIIILVCDVISQLPGSQHIVPINAITSLVGAPVVVWVILRKRSVKNVFTG